MKKLPGFTAEASLSETRGPYRVASTGTSVTSVQVLPQQARARWCWTPTGWVRCQPVEVMVNEELLSEATALGRLIL